MRLSDGAILRASVAWYRPWYRLVSIAEICSEISELAQPLIIEWALFVCMHLDVSKGDMLHCLQAVVLATDRMQRDGKS